jgi:hypothetical protein
MSLIRTFTVILVGVVASLLLLATEARFILNPVCLADYQRAKLLSVLLIDPLLGGAIGLFVGFFQKTRVGITAIACLLPQFIILIYPDGGAGWWNDRLPHVLGPQLLMFVPAIVTAHYVWKLRNRRPTD